MVYFDYLIFLTKKVRCYFYPYWQHPPLCHPEERSDEGSRYHCAASQLYATETLRYALSDREGGETKHQPPVGEADAGNVKGFSFFCYGVIQM